MAAEMGWRVVGTDNYPPKGVRVEVWREGLGQFVATPCYGLHLPWWVPLTADKFAPGAVTFPVQPDDRWRAWRESEKAPPPDYPGKYSMTMELCVGRPQAVYFYLRPPVPNQVTTSRPLGNGIVADYADGKLVGVELMAPVGGLVWGEAVAALAPPPDDRNFLLGCLPPAMRTD